MADLKVKQLKIKTGVVKRLTKDKVSYEKEAETQEKKVEKMKADEKDEHDIKKQIEVLQESKAMIPDTLKRLATAHAELEHLIQTYTELNEMEEYITAKNILEQAESVMG